MAAENLNDMYLFAKVVEHGGYSAAASALGMQASRLSRHIVALEKDLGVRLLNRTTRRISVTEAGQTFYRHCAAVVAEAHAEVFFQGNDMPAETGRLHAQRRRGGAVATMFDNFSEKIHVVKVFRCHFINPDYSNFAKVICIIPSSAMIVAGIPCPH